MKNLRMKAARAALDMSQQQLADAVGVSRQTFHAMGPPHPPPPGEDAGRTVLGGLSAGADGPGTNVCASISTEPPRGAPLIFI